MNIIEVKRTVTNGNLVVHNVPHWDGQGELFPDGEELALSGLAMYTLTKIFRYMLDNQITVVDYEKLKDVV